jgi:hypothetical protein
MTMEVEDVGGGVVMVSCDESEMVVTTRLVTSETPGTVREPISGRETTVPVVAAGTSVIFDIEVPSLTLI